MPLGGLIILHLEVKDELNSLLHAGNDMIGLMLGFGALLVNTSLNQDSFPLAIISAFEVLSTIDIAIDIISYHVNSTDRRGILGIKLRVPLMQGTLAPSKGGLARLTISHDGWVQIRAIGVLLPKCFESVLESAVVMTFLKPYASARLRVFSLFIPRARMFLSANLSKRPLNGV